MWFANNNTIRNTFRRFHTVHIFPFFKKKLYIMNENVSDMLLMKKNIVKFFIYF